MMPTTLSDLLSPGTLDEFLQSSWNKSFYYRPGEPGRFAGLFGWPQLNTILQEHRFVSQQIRLVLNGKLHHPSEFAVRQGQDHEQFLRLDPARVNRLLREGATLIVNSVHQMVEPLAELKENLEKVLHETIFINVYATWGLTPGSGGYPHNDDYDLFVLQVSGRKRWMLYGSPDASPGSSPNGSNGHQEMEPVWDRVLEDGDLLYMPRTCSHAVVPLAEPTLHLVVGRTHRTGMSFLRWLGQEIDKRPIFHQELPRFATAADRAEHMAALRREFLAAWDERALERYFAMEDAAAVPLPRFSLPWSATPAGLPPNEGAHLQLTTPRAVSLQPGGDEGVIELWANGERWQFARAAEPVLQSLLDGRPHAIAELCAQASALDGESVRGFLGELVTNGLVAVTNGQRTAADLPRLQTGGDRSAA